MRENNMGIKATLPPSITASNLKISCRVWFLYLIFSYLIPIASFILTANQLFAYYEEPWGTDKELVHLDLKALQETKNQALTQKKSKPFSFAGKAANAIILFHQKIISPIDGTRSHFRPSSSRYMQLAIQRYGFIRGYLMGCDRLLRENGEEWIYRTVKSLGGAYKYDPAVTDKFTK